MSVVTTTCPGRSRRVAKDFGVDGPHPGENPHREVLVPFNCVSLELSTHLPCRRASMELLPFPLLYLLYLGTCRSLVNVGLWEDVPLPSTVPRETTGKVSRLFDDYLFSFTKVRIFFLFVVVVGKGYPSSSSTMVFSLSVYLY